MPIKPVWRVEGIILSSIDYQENDRIITVFSKEEGVVAMLAAGAAKSGSRSSQLSAPLTHAEFVYTKGRGELLRCKETTPLQIHLKLRTSLPLLEAACSMLKCVMQSQLPEKPAPLLFDLLCAYLKHLPLAADPFTLAASFRLKLLKHEGLINMDSFCGDLGFHLSEEEQGLAELLANARQFDRLDTLRLGDAFKNKVEKIFMQQVRH